MTPPPHAEDPRARELHAAEDAFERLQAEHGPLRAQVEADAGMSPETRRMLVDHLEDEEREHTERIALLRAKGGGRRSAPAPSVGSLRRPVPGAPASRGTVGSLRAH